MRGIPSERRPILAVLVAILLSAIVYWVGLSGPFLFDDEQGLAPVKAWLDGQVEMEQVLWSNKSPLLHRSLAMFTFVGNVAIFGFIPFGFKLGNLVIHALCGLLLFGFARTALRCDPKLAPRAGVAAAFVASAWLLHPLWTSTVLYSIQRMAQLACLCGLAALWLFMWARLRLETKQDAIALIALFVGIPALTMLGIQGKQNAAIIPLLCLVLEVAYFRHPRSSKTIYLFFGAVLILPLVLAFVAISLRPAIVFAGYGEYEFGPGDRLLSQTRVLWDYIRLLAVPYTPAMGVFTDDVVPSKSFFEPWTTALASMGLLVVSVTACIYRSRFPSLFAGWFLFLGAHLIESSFLPLELYYEHRNYFPAAGFFLGLTAAGLHAGSKLKSVGIETSRIGLTAVVGILLVYAFQTHGRARVWSDLRTLAHSAAVSHPDSPRAIMTYIGSEMDAGNTAGAIQIADLTVRQSKLPRTRGLARLFRIRANCALGMRIPPMELDAAMQDLPPHVDLTTALTFGYVASGVLPGKSCSGLSASDVAEAMAQTADRDRKQPPGSYPKLFLRHASARLFANEKLWKNAEEQGRLAWQPEANPTAAIVLVESLLRQGKQDDAGAVVMAAEKRARRGIPADEHALLELGRLMRQGRSAE